jgi:hypothetical protein
MYFYPWGKKCITDVRWHQHSNEILDGPYGIPAENRYAEVTIKKIKSLIHLKHFQPVILCHDQEPLQFDLYNEHSEYVKMVAESSKNKKDIDLSPDMLRQNLRLSGMASVQKSWILLHSEINSIELKKYESTGRLCGAYWWSHAVIARDWYRFSHIDQALQPGNIRKLFLSYCRDDTGLRNYRKDFKKLVHFYQLENYCQTQSFNNTEVSADSSSVYNAEDFNHTGISVVLETVFDQRIHLTEKILRAIACGHPFILAAGPGSLQLLRSYGFHTFCGYINEDYDTITDKNKRLDAIVKEMRRIASLPPKEQNTLIETLRDIAALNKKRFFSDAFFQQVVDELKNNVATAFETHQGELDFSTWWQHRKWRKQQLGINWRQAPNISAFSYLIPLYRQQRLQQRINREQ